METAPLATADAFRICFKEISIQDCGKDDTVLVHTLHGVQ